MSTDSQSSTERRAAGAWLLGSAFLAVRAMLHHPSSAHGGPSLGGGLSLGQLVHGIMLVVLTAQVWAMIVYSRTRGLGGWVLPALVAYGVNLVAHLIAATVNGFVVPALAVRLDSAASHRTGFRLLVRRSACPFPARAPSRPRGAGSRPCSVDCAPVRPSGHECVRSPAGLQRPHGVARSHRCAACSTTPGLTGPCYRRSITNCICDKNQIGS